MKKYILCLAVLLGTFDVQTTFWANADQVESMDADSYKAFVEQTGNEIISVLVHKDEPMSERKKAFRGILQTKFSVPSIAKFVLARHWRGASDAQKARYLTLFETAIVENYAAQFDNYANEKLEVTGAQPTGDGGFLVTSRILRPSGAQPLQVDWKVYAQSKHAEAPKKVVDIVVNGVSMSITQRSEYASLLQQAGGNMDAFLDNLAKKYDA